MVGFRLVIILMLQLTFTPSCKKLVEVEAPVTGVNADNVYQSDATASAHLVGIYSNLGGLLNGASGISVQSGLSADELKLWSGSTDAKHKAFYQNALNNSSNLTNWSAYYFCLLQVNSAIEGLTSSTSLTPGVKSQLLGEAKFVRAFLYFYLVNYYGDVPLILTSDYRINSTIGRTVKNLVWDHIIADLKDAQTLLTDKYVGANVLVNSTERSRPNKWAATALLARSYLYTSQWASAEIEATAVINNTSLFDTVSISNGVFNKNSKEAIWQLQPTNTNQNTGDGNTFILQNSPNNSQPFYINNALLNAFDSADKRKIGWVGKFVSGADTFYFPYKYKIYQSSSLMEYLMILRLGEQYLIRAEARAQQNKLTEARNDLNVIRARAGLPNVTADEKASLLAAILQERRVELFTELGHRWLDLKRTNNVDVIMAIVTVQKGGTWESTDQLYPLPLADLQRNSNLNQNLGY
ncbi:hypothetical protein A4R26_32665 [Niastella populi]|uniref:Starch-binding protein n=2 Tax=Niastella populi TaxID=550983 RepID=A0A1V9GBI4_9BACT|nr:hypothetical protein A4R26_32665 [Niastella populi]